jgi:hypothetical protein
MCGMRLSIFSKPWLTLAALAVWPVLAYLCIGRDWEKPDPIAKPKLEPCIYFIGNRTAPPQKLLVDGREVYSYDSYKLVDSKRIQLQEVVDPSRVKLLALTPEGWIDRSSCIGAGTYNNDCCCSAGIGEFEPVMDLYVDNRNHPATVISCGELPIPIVADCKGKWTLAPPKTAASAVLRLDGKEVGTIWPQDNQPTDAKGNFKGIWLVDTTGQRSYFYGEILYSTAALGTKDRAPLHRMMSNNFLHALPVHPDYFLETAPWTIYSPGNLFVTKHIVSEHLNPPSPPREETANVNKAKPLDRKD